MVGLKIILLLLLLTSVAALVPEHVFLPKPNAI